MSGSKAAGIALSRGLRPRRSALRRWYADRTVIVRQGERDTHSLLRRGRAATAPRRHGARIIHDLGQESHIWRDLGQERTSQSPPQEALALPARVLFRFRIDDATTNPWCCAKRIPWLVCLVLKFGVGFHLSRWRILSPLEEAWFEQLALPISAGELSTPRAP